MHAQFQMSGTKTRWVHGLKWMVKILIPLEINDSPPSWPSFPRFNAGQFHASAFTCSNSARMRSACKRRRKNRHGRVVPGHHLYRIFKQNYRSSVQYSLKWELHPAKTIVSWKHEVIFHLHERKPNFQQLIGHPNPFKITTTERNSPLLSATPSPLLLPAQRLASGESQVRSRFSWRLTAKCTESVCLTVENCINRRRCDALDVKKWGLSSMFSWFPFWAVVRRWIMKCQRGCGKKPRGIYGIPNSGSKLLLPWHVGIWSMHDVCMTTQSNANYKKMRM